MTGPDERRADEQPDECGPLKLPPPDPATVAACHAGELAGIRAEFRRDGREIGRDEDGVWRCRDDGKVTAEADGMGALWVRLLRLDREHGL